MSDNLEENIKLFNRNKKVKTLFDNLIQNNFKKCFRIILKNIDLLLNI